MIQKHWRGADGRSRVSAQLEREVLALQAEAAGENADDATDEIVAVDNTASRTESEVLFAQMEARVEAEVAAEMQQQEEEEQDNTYLTVTVPEGSGAGDELILQVSRAVTSFSCYLTALRSVYQQLERSVEPGSIHESRRLCRRLTTRSSLL